MVDRTQMNPITWYVDVLGLPQLDQVLPMPVDVINAAGLPTPKEIMTRVSGDVKSKVESFAPRRSF